tara:strand:+ start:1228 stop:3684 length:2457 start_codon:yes stop_codon:yes gene_type:complete
MALYGDAAGRPLSKIYKRVGIRRDQDLGDLSSSSKGLENLLDSLVDTPGESFIVEDLNSIKNIFARGLEVGNYRNIIGSSVKITVPTGETVAYDPRITYQNRIDKFELFSGNPRFAGGDGLTANYYQNDQINFNSLTSFPYNNFSTGNPLNPNLSESNIFLDSTSEGEIESDNFWEHGEFSYTGKVHPQSVKANTGVMWEGYYVPRFTGTTEFTINSTGFYTFDFATEGYFENDNREQTPASVSAGVATYTSYARVGITTTIAATGSTGNAITIATNRIPTVGIGMSVSGSNINSTGGTPIVGSVNRTTGVITLTPVDGQTNSVTGSLSNDVTFIRDFGTFARRTFTTQTLTAFEKYRIRIRYFHPQVEDSDTVLENQIRNINKQITIHHRPANSNELNDLDFRYLYDLNYDFSEGAKGNFNKYFDKSVLFGGTVLGEGIGSRSTFNEYTRLKSTNKVDLKYKVKESLAKITKVDSRSGTLTNGSKIIAINPTGSIEIGNYVFGTNIPENTRVDEIATNNFIVVSKAATGSGAQNLKFIDHRGFVKKVSGSHSGLTISGITPALKASSQDFTTIDTDVQVGMVAIGSNLNSYSEITSLTTNSMQISRNVTSTGSADVYIYQSRGLKDNSIQNFCDRFRTTTDGPRIRCLVSDVSSTQAAGITTVKVSNLNGVAAGWELQGAYFTTSTDTTASAGIIVASVNSTNNVITLNSGITRPLPTGAQFTAVSNETASKQNEDYQLCCPPTDTSPPFDASEEGLNTTSTYPNFKLVGGNLIFDSLIIQDTNSNAADIPSGNAMSVNRKINIKTASGNFKLLATT